MSLTKAFMTLTVYFATALYASAKVDETKLAPEKKIKLGLYLEVRATSEFSKNNAARILFMDVRTRKEAMFVGMPATVDALIPFVETVEIMSSWDAAKSGYLLQPVQDFVPELNRRLKEKELTKEDISIVICCSGDRSSRAAN